MNIKKKLAFAFLLLMLVGVGAGILLTSARRTPMQVVGTLSPKEVAEITSAVHQQMWRSTFSGFSWKKIPGLPGAIIKNITCHISGVYGDGQSAFVIVANNKAKPPIAVYANKTPKGWVCSGGF